MVPWLFGLAPYGLVIGISAARSHVPILAAWLSGPLVFSGSAQVVTIQLLHSGAAPAVVVAAALAINLRLILYSATMAPHWKGTPRWWQGLAAYALVDPSLAVGVDGYERARDRSEGHLHYIGGAAMLWIAWIAAITLGLTVGTGVPAALHVEFVIPLFLVGEVVRRTGTHAARRGVGTAIVLGLAGTWAPMHLGALLAIAGGVGAAMLATETPR